MQGVACDKVLLVTARLLLVTASYKVLLVTARLLLVTALYKVLLVTARLLLVTALYNKTIRFIHKHSVLYDLARRTVLAAHSSNVA
jgi:hypothetical protein